ncbi:MAG TPA: hypothetical protein VNW46_01385 [Gemmatimonadaceae bacterium]|jgi:hypothetical protein|nr:hypothetical protein [Gemmatimonadaceae bacterium]
MMRHVIAAWAFGLSLAYPLGAQEMDIRSLRVSRAVSGSDTSLMHVNITYGVGTLTVEPSATPVLYDARLVYPADRATPVATFDQASRTLALGIKKRNFDVPGKDSEGVLHVQVARGVPLDLSLQIGATDATLNLGGLAVHSLTLKGGATEATLRFDSANTIRMESMDLKVGAADFHARGLANARAKHIAIKGAAGDIDLSFDGTWSNDVTLDSRVYFGHMRIHVPPNIQVYSTAKAILGEVSDAGDHLAAAAADTSDDSDNSDSSDMQDMGDMGDSSKMVKAHPHPHPAPMPVVHQGPTYTLRISGSATIGSLEIMHDAPLQTSSH